MAEPLYIKTIDDARFFFAAMYALSLEQFEGFGFPNEMWHVYRESPLEFLVSRRVVSVALNASCDACFDFILKDAVKKRTEWRRKGPWSRGPLSTASR